MHQARTKKETQAITQPFFSMFQRVPAKSLLPAAVSSRTETLRRRSSSSRISDLEPCPSCPAAESRLPRCRGAGAAPSSSHRNWIFRAFAGGQRARTRWALYYFIEPCALWLFFFLSLLRWCYSLSWERTVWSGLLYWEDLFERGAFLLLGWKSLKKYDVAYFFRNLVLLLLSPLVCEDMNIISSFKKSCFHCYWMMRHCKSLRNPPLMWLIYVDYCFSEHEIYVKIVVFSTEIQKYIL